MISKSISRRLSQEDNIKDHIKNCLRFIQLWRMILKIELEVLEI